MAEGRLRSRVNGADYGIGDLELVSLQALRERLSPRSGRAGRLRATVVQGDVRQLHRMPAYQGALFQVASQFNLLEMSDPSVTPEQGVTRYQWDRTQGPACAIAAGAATIYRNYFVPVGAGLGQTADRQLDGLVDLGAALSERLGQSVADLWSMQNGYALCSAAGLSAIAGHLAASTQDEIDILRGRLRIGLHRDVEVTEVPGPGRPRVSQVFCSALPLSYGVESGDWQPFASLVLEAAYEATLWAAVLNAQRGGSNVVLLTLLGGGAFGNRSRWIHDALRRALQRAVGFDLEVKLVSHGQPSRETLAVVEAFR